MGHLWHQTEGTVGAFFLLEIVWKWVPAALLNVAGTQGSGPAPGWVAFVTYAVPSSAYLNATSSLVPGAPTVLVRVPKPRPFYLEAWFSVLVMLLWILVSLTAGYWRFQRIDI